MARNEPGIQFHVAQGRVPYQPPEEGQVAGEALELRRLQRLGQPEERRVAVLAPAITFASIGS
jgi:hypothetical protein